MLKQLGQQLHLKVFGVKCNKLCTPGFCNFTEIAIHLSFGIFSHSPEFWNLLPFT